MRKLLKSLVVAGALGCAALSAGPAAAADAGVQFEKLQQSGAGIRFTQGFNALSGAATGGGIPLGRGGYGRGGYGGGGYGRGGYGHRGYGGPRFGGGRGYYGRRHFGPGYGRGYRRW